MPKSRTATARERELYRYYQPAQESGTADAQSPTVPQSSSDPCLTAFAQLGALRLNAKRGLITLSSISAEYILAEAGQSLSLQKDDDHKDRLWHGVGVLKDNSGLGPDLVKLFCTPEADVPFVVINDLTKHETFKHKSVVAGPPYVRSLACVPLISPLHSMVIGTYIVVDDKPRDGLNEDEITYLIDMATTVMDYLESGRIKKKEFRAERMVKAIGLFIEGKETLRDWWLEAGFKSHRSTVTKRARDDVGELKEVADAVFGVQDPPAEEISVNGMSGLPDRSDFCPATPSTETPSHLDLGDGRPAASRGDSLFSSSDTTVPSTILSQPRERAISMTTYEVDGVTPTSETKGHSVAFELPPESERPEISKELQEAVLSNEVKRVFSRAGNLIREAVGVSGVVYFDASVGSFGGGSETDALEEKAPQGSLIDAAILNGEDDVGLRSSDTDASMYGTPPESPVRPPEKTCNILGYSTRKRSSLRGHSPSSELCGFPEAVLRKLLKRYPHGMVFYFDEDGSYLSADSDEISGTKEKRRSLSPHRSNSLDSRSRRKRISREAEAAAILKALPGARSVFWFPLWDQSRERWFAGSLVWSTSPTRVLSTFEDLAYMAAFGNSTMTEVTRLFAQRISHMKSDFISSISHELRSPLHGILASVEFLQETPMSEIQTDMVGNIQASGKVLLDTIDHVLDFSKVNMKPKDLKQRTKRPGKRPRKPREEAKGLDGAEIEEVADVCVLSEEVIESIYIGHQITKLASSGGVVLGNQPPSASDEPPVTVIVDIAWSPNWTFEVDPGAWRRVLMNIFNNAMKYTNSGYVKVSLKITDDPQYRGKGTRPILSLSVQDSGKGMSKEFLNHHVYKPFAQEDELAEGAGLGLSIVRRIVHDLKGKIKISSEQGSGTDVTIRIPLMCATPLSKDVHGDLISEVKKETTGLKFCLQGFDRYPSIAETPTGILSADLEAAMLLKSSLKTLLTDWFGMESVTPLALGDSNVDVVILMESGITSLEDTLKSYSDARPATSKNLIAIVLCSAHHSDSTTVSYGSTRAFYLQQPYGPHKIAKILQNALSHRAANIPDAENRAKLEDSRSEAINDLKPKFKHPLRRTTTNTSATHDWATAKSNPEPPRAAEPPIKPSEELEIDSKPSNESANIGAENMRVLLVEDNEINLNLLVAYMRKLKLDHATACNGLEALDVYKRARGGFDAIFMDISMPVMSGTESTRHIRRFEREEGLHPVALIALTGAANPNTRQEAFSSGVDLFLTKPVPMKSLKVMLDNLKTNGRKGLMDGDVPSIYAGAYGPKSQIYHKI